MTMTPLVSNKFGAYGKKDISEASGWDLTSLDEALVPFINEINPDRAILAYTHRAQITPIKDGEVPIVSTGAENIIPQLASAKFLQNASDDGVVQEVVKDTYVKVKYRNNKVEFLDITPRLSATKRSSYIRLSMQTLDVGEKFKKGEAIAWTNSIKDNKYVCGKNLKMAVMNYMGYSFEDGYAISEESANTFQTEHIEQVNVLIPLDSKITKLQTDKTETSTGDVLVEFGYVGDIDDYLEKYNIIDEESEEIEAALYQLMGNKIKTLSPGGEIVDIKIYLNNRQSADSKLLKAWNDIVKDLKTRQKQYSHGKTNQKEKISSVDNLDMSQIKIGGHKFRTVEFSGARIVFYIKKDRSLGHGDKICNRYGAKGIITKVIPKEQTCYTEYTGNIDIFISPLSVLRRKNLAVIKELYIGKIIYNLPKIISKKAKDNRTTLKSIKQTILSVYDLLDATDNKKYLESVKKNLNSLPDTKLNKLLINEEFHFNFIIEPFVNLPLNNVLDAADLLDIPLDEHVYIPETKSWTKKPVPVGIQYISTMEQLSEDYESLRSTGKYRSLTGQPVKGRANMGGQSVGNLDVYCLLSYDLKSSLKELMSVRSDDRQSEREMTLDIIRNGSAKLPQSTKTTSSKDLYKLHMIGMGLNP